MLVKLRRFFSSPFLVQRIYRKNRIWKFCSSSFWFEIWLFYISSIEASSSKCWEFSLILENIHEQNQSNNLMKYIIRFGKFLLPMRESLQKPNSLWNECRFRRNLFLNYPVYQSENKKPSLLDPWNIWYFIQKSYPENIGTAVNIGKIVQAKKLLWQINFFCFILTQVVSKNLRSNSSKKTVHVNFYLITDSNC